MTKDEVIAKVQSLRLPKNSYVVFGSGPLAVLGIREVNDIDLLVSKETLKKLKAAGWEKLHKSPKDAPLVYDVFEAHDNWNFSRYRPTLKDLLSRAMEVDGVMFASLQDVQKWKSVCRRTKDFADVELIKKYLTKRSINS